jgi:hypothetical protein
MAPRRVVLIDPRRDRTARLLPLLEVLLAEQLELQRRI